MAGCAKERYGQSFIEMYTNAVIPSLGGSATAGLAVDLAGSATLAGRLGVRFLYSTGVVGLGVGVYNGGFAIGATLYCSDQCTPKGP